MKTTLRIILNSCIFILLVSLNLAGQTCTYENMYENPADWTLIEGGENLPDVPEHPGPGLLFIDNNRLKMYQLSGGGHDMRLYRTIPALSDIWAVEFDMRIDDGNTSFGPGAFYHTVLGLTAGNQIPLTNLVYPFDYDNPEFVNSEQDGIVMELISVGTTTSVHVKINDDGAITEACSVDLPWNVVNILPRNVSVKLENFGDGFGQLTVNKTNGALIDQCCFAISSSIENLTHIQHGNSPIPGYERYLTGGIRNLCITDGATVSTSCNETTGIESVDQINAFSMILFPNPVSDILTILIHSPGKEASRWSVNIFDLQGRLLMQKAFLNSEGLNQGIDISALAVGSYTVHVQSGDLQFQDKKIMIKL